MGDPSFRAPHPNTNTPRRFQKKLATVIPPEVGWEPPPVDFPPSQPSHRSTPLRTPTQPPAQRTTAEAGGGAPEARSRRPHQRRHAHGPCRLKPQASASRSPSDPQPQNTKIFFSKVFSILEKMCASTPLFLDPMSVLTVRHKSETDYCGPVWFV